MTGINCDLFFFLFNLKLNWSDLNDYKYKYLYKENIQKSEKKFFRCSENQ